MTTPQPRTCRLILVAAVFVVMGRLLLCDFTWWDDQMTIHHNRLMNPVTWETFRHYWSTPAANIYVPLTQTIWALLTFVARIQPDPLGISLNPTIYHGANVLAHLGGALAAWALLRRLVKNDLAALLGALIWAVHPVQVESVGWVSGLKDVLSGALVLTALAAFVRYRQEGAARFYAIAVVCYAMALLAKPSAFTMPLLVVVIDRFVLQMPWRKVMMALWPLVLITIPIALIARAAQPAPGSAAPAWVRPLLVGDTLSFYAIKVIAPIELAFDYGRDVTTLRAGRELYFAWLLPVCTAAIVISIYIRSRRLGRPLSPLPGAALLLFVLAPLHVLGLTRFDFQLISTVADHYLYVAMIGPALLLAWAVARWPKVAVAAAVMVAAYGARAAWQTRTWQDSDTFFGHTLAINPRSWTSYLNMHLLAAQRNDHATAERYILQAETIVPENATVVLNLVALYASQGNDERAEFYARKLIDLYHQKWQTEGASPAVAHVHVVGLFMANGRFDAAEKFIKEGQLLDPTERGLAVLAEQLRWKRSAAAPTTARTHY